MSNNQRHTNFTAAFYFRIEMDKRLAGTNRNCRVHSGLLAQPYTCTQERIETRSLLELLFIAYCVLRTRTAVAENKRKRFKRSISNYVQTL